MAIRKLHPDLGDASKITGTISENFSAIELIGYRKLLLQKI